MSKKIARMMRNEEKRLAAMPEQNFTIFYEGILCDGVKIMSPKGTLFCIVDFGHNQVIIPDTNGGLHHYPTPQHTRGMIAPAINKKREEPE